MLQSRGRALFVVLPFTSHYYSVFHLAKLMSDVGWQVCFSGLEAFRDVVVRQGFSFHKLSYTTEIGVESFRMLLGLFLKTVTQPQFTRARFKEWLRGGRDMEELLANVNPDIVLLDEQVGHYLVNLIHLRRRTILVNTRMPFAKEKGIPPLNVKHRPTNSLYSRVYCEFAWRICKINISLNKAKETIAFTFCDDSYFQKRFCLKHRIQWSSFYKGKNILRYDEYAFPHRIHLVQKRLFYEWERTGRQGIAVDIPIYRIEEFDQGYQNVVREIELHKARGTKIVYCSIGSVLDASSNYMVRTFLQNVADALGDCNRYFVIISGSGLQSLRPRDSSSVRIFKNIPQLDILRRCDLVITHGGLTTVKECLEAGVGMLIYPINNDQFSNAMRALTNGVASVGDIRKETAFGIMEKVNQLVSKVKVTQAAYSPEEQTFVLDYIDSVASVNNARTKQLS